MRKLHIPGRSNVIGMNGLAATSQPLSSLEAINILKKGVESFELLPSSSRFGLGLPITSNEVTLSFFFMFIK